MRIERVLIANRSEIAVRIARAAAEVGIASVAVRAADDQSPHVRAADEVKTLPLRGPAAYLDIRALIAAARSSGCDAVHPGYGFLSESAEFAHACIAADLVFIGPKPTTLEELGDKQRARELAGRLGIPMLEAAEGVVDLEGALEFLARLPSGTGMVLKAVAGGGGRGIRLIRSVEECRTAFPQCSAEARAVFGNGALIAERIAENARHIEIQIVGDGGTVTHLWERDCTLQRRQQKVIEFAPAPFLAPSLREKMIDAAVSLGRAVDYHGIGTVEFLVEPASARFNFMEVNPRIQVEHTVSETITGVDLVQVQFKLACGLSLKEAGLDPTIPPVPRGFALQLRVNAETVLADGTVNAANGTILRCQFPTRPGVRVDTAAEPEMLVDPRYDSLLAKLIVSAQNFDQLLARAKAALLDVRIDGVATNIGLLQALLQNEDVTNGTADTQFVNEQCSRLSQPDVEEIPADNQAQDGVEIVRSPLSGVIVEIRTTAGSDIRLGETIVVIEAMKMQTHVCASGGGTIDTVRVVVGDVVAAGTPLVSMVSNPELGPMDTGAPREETALRPDLANLFERTALLDDAARPDSIARRHATGKRTARENIADLCLPDSFHEIGGLTFAAQRLRKPVDELRRSTPADGLVTGLGRISADSVDGPPTARWAAVFAYDYTVIAGTQSLMNHKKLRRLLAIAEQRALPLIGFVEGGGGRPGDVDDATRATGLDMTGFLQFARLKSPRIAIASGRCFAGNAVLAGSSDILIATRDSNLGMAGPAMVEGAGLGVLSAEAIGPVSDQVTNGVIDILVEDEAEATTKARQVLSLLTGSVTAGSCSDQNRLRDAIPLDRRRSYDIRPIIELLADQHSVIELRPFYGMAIVSSLARISGLVVGILANNPSHLAGAIDAVASKKAAEFLLFCNRFSIPILSLCDTPGFMVGPEAERDGLVRHSSAMFAAAAHLDVPLAVVLIRRGYGLGAMAMTGGSFHAPQMTVAWPSGEFGGMGIEGAVRLGFKAELAAEQDPTAKQVLLDRLVADAYERGKATTVAESVEIDAVIDPAETRAWVLGCFAQSTKYHEARKLH